MAQRLAEVGADLFRKTTVGDNLNRMADVLGGAMARADCVITGGGLGPTEDDLTRQAVARVTGRPLHPHPDALHDLQERFRSRGFVLTPNNEKQALLPRGAILVQNPNGTAPAFVVEDARCTIICLPGVPFEMKWLMEHVVVPYLRRRWRLKQVIHHRVLKVGELGESAVDHRIGAIMTASANPKVGVLAHPGQVDVRISARAESEEAARRLIEPTEADIRAALGDHVFAVDGETLESVVADLLARRGWRVASYEDRTGGTVAAALREAAGSASWRAASSPPRPRGSAWPRPPARERTGQAGHWRRPWPAPCAGSAAPTWPSRCTRPTPAWPAPPARWRGLQR